jgi:hypothetical protein
MPISSHHSRETADHLRMLTEKARACNPRPAECHQASLCTVKKTTAVKSEPGCGMDSWAPVPARKLGIKEQNFNTRTFTIDSSTPICIRAS